MLLHSLPPSLGQTLPPIISASFPLSPEEPRVSHMLGKCSTTEPVGPFPNSPVIPLLNMTPRVDVQPCLTPFSLHAPSSRGALEDPGPQVSSQTLSTLKPSFPTSKRSMKILTGGFFNTSWLASLALGPSKEEKKRFQVSSYFRAHFQPTYLPCSSSLEARERWGSICSPAATTAPASDATMLVATASQLLHA